MTEEDKPEKEEKKKREEYVIKIGPLLKKVLDKQKENIKNVTYECVNPSDYDAGEIVAKKIMKKGGIKDIKKNSV